MDSEVIHFQPKVHRALIFFGVASTISLVAVYGVLLYVVGLILTSRFAKSAEVQRATALRLDFLATPFGLLFVNLMIADSMQHLGFAFSWVHLARGSVTSPSPFCTGQAVLIQIGDVASMFANFFIAIQTLSVLTMRHHSRRWVTLLEIAGFWIADIGMGIITPSVYAWTGPTAFYDWTGAWCWIADDYNAYRLWTHYIFVFVALFGSIVIYGLLFALLHSKVRNRVTTFTRSAPDQAYATPQRQKQLEWVARRMLLYPIAGCVLHLPLTVYRLGNYAQVDHSLTGLVICATIWSLTGFVDMSLFGFMRNVIKAPSIRRGTASEPDDSLEVHVLQETRVVSESTPDPTKDVPPTRYRAYDLGWYPTRTSSKSAEREKMESNSSLST